MRARKAVRETSAATSEANGAALGGRLKLARTGAGLTLDDVAEASGMTSGHLSRLERGEKLPSIGALVRLAKALGTTVGDLMGADPVDSELVIARASDRTRLGRSSPKKVVRYEVVLREAACAGQSVTAFVAHPDPDAGTVEDTSHQGVEFIFVLSGAIEVVFAERVVELGAGDVLLFPGYLRHRLRRCRPDDDASALVVMVGA